jgi:hypothetical protein
MLSLERYTDLYNRRAAGTLDPDSLNALNLLDQKGRTTQLEQMRQAAPATQSTQQEMPSSSPAPSPPPQYGSSLTNEALARPTVTPTTGVSQDELATLERRRQQHADATGRVAPGPLGLPPNLALAQQEGELLQRTLGAPAPPGAPPSTQPAAPAPVTPATAPPTTTTQPPPPAAAAPSPAPTTPADAPRLTPEQHAAALQNYKDIKQEIATEGRADTGAMWADKLNLPAADMPGGQYEGAERFAGATPADVVRGMKEHPIRTPLNILGAPMNSVAAAATAAARPFFEPQTAAVLGDVAGVAAGLAMAPGTPGTGAFRAAPVVKKLEKVSNVEGRAAAGAASADATKRLATRGLKVDPRKVINQFQNHVEAARAAVSPAEMVNSLKRAVTVVEQKYPGAKWETVEQVKSVVAKMEQLQRKIGFREAVTRGGRKLRNIGAGLALGEMGIRHITKELGRKR